MTRIIKKRGFTIYFAVLVASLAITVGVAIYDLLSRELTLSQVATQSQYAIYAADTGIECALYWDYKYSGSGNDVVFATSSESTLSPSNADLQCAGQNIRPLLTFPTPPSPNPASKAATTTFQINVGAPACAIVTVAKSGGMLAPKTVVTANGRNTCATTGTLRVERTLQAIY